MAKQENKMYRLNDDICFRKCCLADNQIHLENDDYTNFNAKEVSKEIHFSCKQYGIHLHCTKHPQYELSVLHEETFDYDYLCCPICKESIYIESVDETIKDCLRLLNTPKFKDAKLIRLDDWYIPELKYEVKDEKISDYWIKSDVKTDKDGDTIVVLYVGSKNNTEKAQFFIKPEKLQLSTDHKDLDPSKILSKIEVTLKDRTIKQDYD